MSEATPALEARGLALSTRRGHVYGPVDLTLLPGETAMLLGPAGCGKTALLLTLGARMRPSAGSLRVAGTDALNRPRAARRVAAFGVMPHVSEFAGTLTVDETARADLVLAGGLITRERVRAVLDAVDLDLDLGTRVEALTMGQRAMLGVALALAGRPSLLLVDDVDEHLAPAERDRLLGLLTLVASRGIAVVGSCIDPASAATADAVVRLTPSTESGVTQHAFAHAG